MWNSLGPQCHICLKAYEDECQTNDVSYRKRILLACSSHLFSEFGVDWNSISTEESLPFCAPCLENIEEIIQYSDESESILADIKSCVPPFMLKALRSRKQMKDKGVTLPASLTTSVNSRVKMEILEQQTCVVCYNFYVDECRNEELTFESKKNILEQCKEHLYSDFISNSGGFDWNTIPERNILPFCGNCYLTVDKICELGNRFNNCQTKLSDFLDKFLIEAFECRDALKKKSVSGGNSTSVNNKTSFSVGAGQTTIVINNKRPATDENDFIVSASDERGYTSSNNEDVPCIVETNTLSHPEDVSSTNQSGAQSILTRTSRSLQSQRTIFNKTSVESVAMPSGPQITKSRIFADAQLVINSVNNIILPPGTSIEELPPSANHECEMEAEVIEEARSSSAARKPRKKRRFRFSEDSKIRTRSRCGKCSRNFTYERNYNKHKETCVGFERYSAGPSTPSEHEVSFEEMPELEVEYSNYPDVQMETVTDSFSCSFQNCEKKFQTKENVERHMLLHTANRPHQCKNCKATFVQLNHLKNHMRQKNCNTTTASSSTIWSSTPKKGKKSKGVSNANAGSPAKRPFLYSCMYCEFNARNSTVLSQHLQGHADIAVDSICSICRHVCSNKYTLRVHKKRKHSNTSDLPFDQVMQLLNTEESLEHTKRNSAPGLWVKSGFAQSD